MNDILGEYRMNNFKRHSYHKSKCCVYCVKNEYDQVEIKIYRFINAINESSGYKIHKILGNREVCN